MAPISITSARALTHLIEKTPAVVYAALIALGEAELTTNCVLACLAWMIYSVQLLAYLGLERLLFPGMELIYGMERSI